MSLKCGVIFLKSDLTGCISGNPNQIQHKWESCWKNFQKSITQKLYSIDIPNFWMNSILEVTITVRKKIYKKILMELLADHSIILKNLNRIANPWTIVFFGPVYESISKKGYLPRVSLPELGAALHSNHKEQRSQVYALGGVRRKKIPELFDLGFDGVALFGSIWGKKDPVLAFEKYLYIERSTWGKKEKEQSLIKRLFTPE